MDRRVLQRLVTRDPAPMGLNPHSSLLPWRSGCPFANPSCRAWLWVSLRGLLRPRGGPFPHLSPLLHQQMHRQHRSVRIPWASQQWAGRWTAWRPLRITVVFRSSVESWLWVVSGKLPPTGSFCNGPSAPWWHPRLLLRLGHWLGCRHPALTKWRVDAWPSPRLSKCRVQPQPQIVHE
jgi:hypothetical protein